MDINLYFTSVEGLLVFKKKMTSAKKLHFFQHQKNF